jgi:hypothetical protein
LRIQKLKKGGVKKEAKKMDGMQNWTNYLETMRNRLLTVHDADSLISVLVDMKNIPIALSTIEDVTDGTGLNMSLSVICSEVKIVGRVMCLISDDMFTSVQLNLNMVRRIDSKISVDEKGVVMKLTIKNGAEFLLMFHTDAVDEDEEQ